MSQFKKIVGICDGCGAIRILDKRCPVCHSPAKEEKLDGNKKESGAVVPNK